MPTAPMPPPRHHRSPMAWRWMLFAVAVLFVVSLWVPAVPSEPPETRPTHVWITLPVAVILAVATAAGASALPASWRVRLLVAALMIGTTLLALAMETPIRRWLGSPWWP